MAQEHLHHQNPLQHWEQLTNVGNLEHSAQLSDSSTSPQEMVSFPGDSVDLNLFLAAGLVSGFFVTWLD